MNRGGREQRPHREPLGALSSIRVKLALLVGVSTVVAALVAEAGNRAGVPAWVSLPVTIAGAVAVAAWLARGMTAPLREMTAVAGQMATGDYSARVGTTSTDEVGLLAHAFDTMAADLAAVDQQRRELISTVSHELRTPLTAQRALLENVVDGVVAPDDEMLRIALRQSERLAGLVEDLLDLSRIDAGSRPLRMAQVPVRELLDRCMAEASVTGRPVRYDVHVTPEHLRVSADADRLHQVVANLLDNAQRHSPPGGTVQITAEAGPRHTWRLRVADQGPGVAPEATGRIFERFGTAAGGGTGLGLAIARWVVDLHGGTIRLAPGAEGATFEVDLPIRPIGPRPTDSPTTTQGEATVTTPPAQVKPSADRTSAGPPAPAATVDQVFGRFWPEPTLPTQLSLVLGSIAVGLLGAWLLPETPRAGLGAFLVLVAGGLLVRRVSPHRLQPWSVVSAALCLGLAATTVLLAAEWLVVLCLVIAAALVTTALTRAWTLPAILASGMAWVLAAVRGLPLLGRTVAATSRQRLLWPVLRTVAISLLALLVFGALFSSADALFGSWVEAVLPDWDPSSLIYRGFVLFLITGLVLTAAYLSINPPRMDRVSLPTPRPARHRWEWLVPLGIVVVLFTGFLIAQASAMWGGHDYLHRSTGLTYAEYVHRGFGELTVASLLTLLVLWWVSRRANRAVAGNRLALRLGAGALCLLTLLVVVSALHRMQLYQEAYGFTVLRLVVDAFELWVGVVVVLTLVAGIRLSGRWLPRAALLSGAVMVLGLAVLNPEAWVAGHNIARYEATGKLDVHYLASLGADATPTVLDGLPADLAGCVVHPEDALDSADRGLAAVAGWNLGVQRAEEAVRAIPRGTLSCVVPDGLDR